MKWKVLNEVNKEKWSLEEITKLLLENRGVKTKKERDDFFYPRDPIKLLLKELEIGKKEIDEAVKRIKEAIKNKEEILIYGDYDVDGVAATAILWERLYEMGAKVMPYIPDRISEGYGLNVKTAKRLAKEKKNLGLVITVDNGIAAWEAVLFLKKKGIDCLITDHHEKPKKIPKARVIIHTTKICGSGISWVLARELGAGKEGLDLAAMGTITDMMPLVGVNRAIVTFGLRELNKLQRKGLKALVDGANILPKTLGTYEVGYVIGPRINASGRMANAIDSLRLVCTKNTSRAVQLARDLNKLNVSRQEMVTTSLERIAFKYEEIADKIIIEVGDYHEGVIGLVSAKLVESFSRPAIVIGQGELVSKGSARSIETFNIINAIRKAEGILESVGGHAGAAGFSIKNENLEKFKEILVAFANETINEKDLEPVLKVDLALSFKDLNWKLVNEITKFEPFGNGNRKPVWASYQVEVVEVRLIGKEKKHLKLALKQKGDVFPAIGFGMGEMFGKLKKGSLIDISYLFEENNFNGLKSMQLVLKDVKLS